jgi:hypothetical protein
VVRRTSFAADRACPAGGAFERWLRLATCLLCGWGLLFGSAHARAEPSAAERETARRAMDDGDRLRAAGDLQAALASYKAAHEIMRVPTTGIEVARTQTELGLLVEARSQAIDTANLPTLAGEPAVFGAARRAAADLSAELEPRIPSITTVVAPSVAAYTLSIDEVRLPGQARLIAFRTNPGKHVVVVEAPGYRSVVRQVLLAEAEQHALQITLERALPPAAEPVQAASAASDGTRDDGHAMRMRGYISLGAGGAIFVAGAIAGIASAVQTHDLKGQCPSGVCPASVEHSLASANTLANVANIAIPIGLLGVAFGVYELIEAPSTPQPAASSAVSIQVNARGAYASWGGAL